MTPSSEPGQRQLLLKLNSANIYGAPTMCRDLQHSIWIHTEYYESKYYGFELQLVDFYETLDK